MKPVSPGWSGRATLSLGALALLPLACAEGVGFEPAERGAFGLGADPGTLPPAPTAGEPAAPAPAADASVADGHTPCSMGEASPCTCPETSTAGTRRCVFDEASPTGGYLDETCRGCAAPSCDDSIANGTETDLDCGGLDCAPCADGLSCMADGDCEGGLCTDGLCSAPEEAPDPAGDEAPEDPPPPPADPPPATGCDPSTCPDCGLLDQPCCSTRDECGCNLLGTPLLCN